MSGDVFPAALLLPVLGACPPGTVHKPVAKHTLLHVRVRNSPVWRVKGCEEGENMPKFVLQKLAVLQTVECGFPSPFPVV